MRLFVFSRPAFNKRAVQMPGCGCAISWLRAGWLQSTRSRCDYKSRCAIKKIQPALKNKKAVKALSLASVSTSFEMRQCAFIMPHVIPAGIDGTTMYELTLTKDVSS